MMNIHWIYDKHKIHLPSAVRSNVVRQRSNLVCLLSTSMCFLRKSAFLNALNSMVWIVLNQQMYIEEVD